MEVYKFLEAIATSIGNWTYKSIWFNFMTFFILFLICDKWDFIRNCSCFILLYFVPHKELLILVVTLKFLPSLLLNTSKTRVLTMETKIPFEKGKLISRKAKVGDILQFPRESSRFSWLPSFGHAYYHWGLYHENGNFYHLTTDNDGKISIRYDSLNYSHAEQSCRINNLEKLAESKNLTRLPNASIFEKVDEWKQRILRNTDSYDLMQLNCEHFVTSCVYGECFSSQSDVIFTSYGKMFYKDFFNLAVGHFIFFNILNIEIVSEILTKKLPKFASNIILYQILEKFILFMSEIEPELFTFLIALWTFLFLTSFHILPTAHAILMVTFGMSLLPLLVWFDVAKLHNEYVPGMYLNITMSLSNELTPNDNENGSESEPLDFFHYFVLLSMPVMLSLFAQLVRIIRSLITRK